MRLIVCLLLVVATSSHAEEKLLGEAAIVAREFIYEKAPFPECHASTIAEVQGELVCAWFGGQEEGRSDVGIWFSRRSNDAWSEPREIANGKQSAGEQLPCWNPVLVARDNLLTLYYKVGPSPSKWWGLSMTSRDAGQSWSKPERLAKDYLGPIKNKPLALSDGTLVCGSSTEHNGWRLHFELFDRSGKELLRVEPQENARAPEAIQPALLKLGDDTIVALCRPRLPGRLVETRSSDGGKSWSSGKHIELPNPNSGVDAVTLADGRHLLIYNHTRFGRSPLNLAIASDDQLQWQAAALLENQPGEYSYPAIIQTEDGLVHITYTWKRDKVRHIVLDASKLAPVPFKDGQWPK